MELGVTRAEEVRQWVPICASKLLNEPRTEYGLSIPWGPIHPQDLRRIEREVGRCPAHVLRLSEDPFAGAFQTCREMFFIRVCGIDSIKPNIEFPLRLH